MTSFAVALAQGGGLGQALRAGIISGISAGAFAALAGGNFDIFGFGPEVSKVLAFGSLGGISNVLQGGKFGHGFVSAGFDGLLGGGIGKVLGPVFGDATPFITNAVVGGTLSEATGGKFANGALYATFQAVVSAAGAAYANAHKAPQLNLPEFSVSEFPEIATELTTTETELVSIDISAPYEGETFDKVAPVSILAAEELNIDWSGVGPTHVLDTPYLDTGISFSEADGRLGAAIQSALQFERQVVSSVLTASSLGAGGGSAIAYFAGATRAGNVLGVVSGITSFAGDVLSGNPYTAQKLLVTEIAPRVATSFGPVGAAGNVHRGIQQLNATAAGLVIGAN